MQPERFRELVEAYGARQERWPASYRRAMVEFLDADPEAADWVQEARSLDSLLDSYEITAPDLSERILRRLPISLPERLMAWLLPSNPKQWWHPLLAGAMPVMVGIAIGLSGLDQSLYAEDGYSWELEERIVLAAPSLETWYE